MGMENPGWMEVYSWENDLLINARFSTATFSLMKGEDWHGLITKDAGIAQPCGFVWWGLIVYISKNQNSLILIPIKLYIVCMYVCIYIYISLIYLIYLAIYLSIYLSLPPSLLFDGTWPIWIWGFGVSPIFRHAFCAFATRCLPISILAIGWSNKKRHKTRRFQRRKRRKPSHLYTFLAVPSGKLT